MNNYTVLGCSASNFDCGFGICAPTRLLKETPAGAERRVSRLSGLVRCRLLGLSGATAQFAGRQH